MDYKEWYISCLRNSPGIIKMLLNKSKLIDIHKDKTNIISWLFLQADIKGHIESCPGCDERLQEFRNLLSVLNKSSLDRTVYVIQTSKQLTNQFLFLRKNVDCPQT